MGEEIVIFNTRQAKKSGSFFVSKKSRRLPLAHLLGRFFIVLSFVGLIIFFLPIITAELKYRFHSFQKQEESSRSKFSLILSPYDNQFELIIPKVGIKTQVLTDVDPANKGEYKKVLGEMAAHAKGSNLPGEGRLVYVFGHSTNSIFDLFHYNPVFYLLKELNPGDEIGIIHQGKVYIYKVAEKRVVRPDDLSMVTLDSNQEKLILQTCWPPGTTWKRLIVIAYPSQPIAQRQKQG